ncbi:MAG TPA: VOC family protein [Terriglobales bacterium]|nr:VOC family protein [Terriglobales bacterium]
MIGKLGLIMVVVKDMKRSTAFYRDVLGLSVRFESPEWTQLDAGNIGVGLHGQSQQLHSDKTNAVQFGFYVDDVQKTVADLKKKGVHVVMEPKKEDFGWLAIIADPDGYHIQLGQTR